MVVTATRKPVWYPHRLTAASTTKGRLDDRNRTSMVLHLDDYPATLELLAAVAGGRHNLSFGELGYEASEHGARVAGRSSPPHR